MGDKKGYETAAGRRALQKVCRPVPISCHGREACAKQLLGKNNLGLTAFAVGKCRRRGRAFHCPFSSRDVGPAGSAERLIQFSGRLLGRD